MMERIVQKQQHFLKAIAGNPQGKKRINGISKLQWIETSYALDGGTLSAEEVRLILSGRYAMSKTVEDHFAVNHYGQMLTYLYDCLAIKDKVDLSLMQRSNEILSQNEMGDMPKEVFRKTVPIVSHLDLIPMHPQDVPRGLERMLRRFYASRTDMDPVMRACHIHNELLRIYPFEKNNEATARAMFNFELLAANLPPIPFTMDRQSYCQAIISHISKEDPQPFYRMTADILCDRFDQLLDIL